MRSIVLFVATAALGSTWSGVLVDRDCYAREERNVGPRDTLTSVDRDRDWEIRYCHPGPKTKSFTLVDHDGRGFAIDDAGNARAAEIARQTSKKSAVVVSIEGEIAGGTIKVESMRAASR